MTAVGVPQNKILVVFNKNRIPQTLQREFLQRTFDLPIENDSSDSIIKGIIWKNKYFELQLDLYIDEFEDFEEFVYEYCLDEMSELRSVIAGIIIIDDTYHFEDNKLVNKLQTDSGSETSSSFMVIGNFEGDYEEEDIAQWRFPSESMTNDEDIIAEYVPLDKHFRMEKNSLGDKVGVPGIKEKLDLHEWNPNCNIQKLDQIQPTHPPSNMDVDISAIINQLRDARINFQTHKDQEEAKSIATALAESIVVKQSADFSCPDI
ncbi:hypothetical protein NCAS_0G00720 [Naumovozyma castellii]|uniref:Increased recombination centers protein 6 n=1 Tax=Naumovozyma castellii TaxID=27288 RepID=G0VHS5_NAUCA|nr:hypothetical protein NCAS_0G00720 [Naumovozyma castellii CBS 4309]CCC70959.1 hypothetical protein NCAS_0G00720 [Naumovozyma castellii CBS 4309]